MITTLPVKFAASICLALSTFCLSASLEVKQESSEQVGAKSLIHLKLTNRFSEKVASVRANAFLVNDQGKVIAQSVKWIVDSTRDKALKPDETRNYTFVLNNEKPFTAAKLIITRVVLESGKIVVPVPKLPANPPSP